MNNTIRTLRARHAQTVAAMAALTALLAKEDREPTPEEQEKFDADKAKLASIKGAIDREMTVIEAMASMGRAGAEGGVALEVPDDATITGGEPGLMRDAKRGFPSMGSFAQAVQGHYRSEGRATDDRLKIIAAAPTTFGNEAAGADGGFAVPPEFSQEIWRYAITEDSLIPWCDDSPVTGNGMVWPKDETVPWGTDGIRAYWQVEATTATQSKPLLGTITTRLHKLMALIPVTDELLADTRALDGYIPEKAGLSIRWKANEAILFGNGNGQPLGAFSVQSTGIQPWLTVSKDSGQATLTLTETNLANMKRSLPPRSMQRAIWLFNNDCEAALITLKTPGGYPLYIPYGGGISAISQPIVGDPSPAQTSDDLEPDGRIYGRPAYLSQHANTFSSLGDFMLADLSYYRVITKAGEGVETATSMHLYFDADATAFRMIFRMDGQPKISKPISPAKGSNKMSPFLQLQAR